MVIKVQYFVLNYGVKCYVSHIYMYIFYNLVFYDDHCTFREAFVRGRRTKCKDFVQLNIYIYIFMYI